MKYSFRCISLRRSYLLALWPPALVFPATPEVMSLTMSALFPFRTANVASFESRTTIP